MKIENYEKRLKTAINLHITTTLSNSVTRFDCQHFTKLFFKLVYILI